MTPVCICGAQIAVSGSGAWVHIEEPPDGYRDHDAAARDMDVPEPEHTPTPSERQASALEGIARSLDELVTWVKSRPT